ncbi:MAG TPA: hypothetical protein VMW49_06790 [Candidatus Dormibacteraeota bacterium]|nr:hypothetical protein [Candidatus Dormibacteraeota bacterium]
MPGADTVAERFAEHFTEHFTERFTEHFTERFAEHLTEHLAEHLAEHVTEHLTEHLTKPLALGQPHRLDPGRAHDSVPVADGRGSGQAHVQADFGVDPRGWRPGGQYPEHRC